MYENNLDGFAPKERHGCVTAWLILLIVINSLLSLVFLFAVFASNKIAMQIPFYQIVILFAAAVSNVVCAIMLMKWKKIGFLGFVATSIVVLIVNLSSSTNPMEIMQSFFGLLGAVVLFAILQIKSDNKSAWQNLE